MKLSDRDMRSPDGGRGRDAAIYVACHLILAALAVWGSVWIFWA